MDKDKPIDRKDNTIENIKEDYKDSNGSPEDFIEDMTDPEATVIFKEAFYAEGKALEKEALRSPFVEDEEKKEALRLRILAAAGRSEEGTSAADRGVADDAVKVSAEAVKKKKRNFTPFMRWAAVLVLVCLGVFGVSVTGQAKGSGLWSSIQRLIGGETRWEQEDNGENRTYTSTEEEKAIQEIEEKLEIEFPIFFYWPDELVFENVYIFEESSSFMIVYSNKNQIIYFEGWKGECNTSLNNTWMSEGKENHVEYDGITYTITKADDEESGKRYYVRWTIEDNRFVLSGIQNLEEVKNILKNIKN